MDAVEFPYPVDLAAPKLKVSVKDGESEGVPILVSRTVERLASQKGGVIMSDVGSRVHASDSARLDKIIETEICRKSSKLPSFQNEHVSEQVHCRGSNYLSSTTRPDSAQIHQTSTKMLKISNLCSTIQGTTQLESMSLAGVDDVKDIHDRHEPRLSKCTFSEKNQLVKQKSHLHSKRSEKRCPRVPAKAKFDSFPVKPGSASFSTASGGNNFLGLYGLKSDAPDVAKLIDDFLLIGLLDGTCQARNWGKNKAKKETDTNVSLMHSVRKAGSILESHKPAKIEDNSTYKKPSTCISATNSCGANGDREETCMAEPGYKNQASSSKPETPGDVLDFPLHQPKDVLERLTLPPPKDLESLLLEASKPIVSSRNTPDPRPGKQVTRSPSLPAFQWSYNFSGQSRTNADMNKLSSSRNTCQGRWGRIGSAPNSLEVANDWIPNLDSLKYENNLIPPEYITEPCISGGLPWFELGSSSSAPRSKAPSGPLESGEDLKHEGNDDDCPRILAAAQTLMDMTTPLPVRQNKDGLTTWQKKASQKTSRARKSRVNEKGLEIPKAPIPFSGPDNPSRSVDQIFASKKPKLSITEKKKDPISHSARKGSPIWSTTPKSIRSSPNTPIPETARHSSTNAGKLSSMMPPPPARSITEWPVGERKDPTAYAFKQPVPMPPLKRKAMNGDDRPRNSAIALTNWHYEGRTDSSSRLTKHSPPSRMAEKTRDSEHKLKKLVADWNGGGGRDTKHSSIMPPPTRTFEKSGEAEQKRRAVDGEERPRKSASAAEKTVDWRNLDKIMDWK